MAIIEMELLAVRFNKKRDKQDLEIFRALQAAGRDPVRCTDFDIGAAHVDGYGVMIEVKSDKGKLRPIQVRLQEIFKDRYRVARSAEAALIACGLAL